MTPLPSMRADIAKILFGKDKKPKNENIRKVR